MKNKKIVLITSLSVLLFSVSIYAVENFETPTNETSTKIQQYVNVKNNKSFNDTIVATVGADSVKQSEVEEFKALRFDNLSYKDCLNKVIENKLLFQQAEKEHLVPTNEEVKKTMKYNKYVLENKSSQKDRNSFNFMIKKLGISYDDYWNNIAINSYKEAIAISNIKNKLLKEAVPDLYENSTKNMEEQNKLDQKLNALISDIKAKTNIKILDKQ